MARTVITPDLIKQINTLYLEIGTYAGVSKALGGSPSPSTIKKYIIPDFSIPTDKIEFDGEICPPEVFPDNFWLSVKEIKEISELKRELMI